MSGGKKSWAEILEALKAQVLPGAAIDAVLRKEIEAGEADLAFIRGLIRNRGTHMPPREMLDNIAPEMKSRTLQAVHGFILGDSEGLAAADTGLMLRKIEEILMDSIAHNWSHLSPRAKKPR